MLSLRGFHLVFIVASIGLALMVSVWGTGMYMSGQGSWGHLAFAAGSLLSAVGMAVYLLAFIRKTRQIGMA